MVELLSHREVSFRRFAADACIDLVPDTARIQPALKRALRDEDSMVVADAARALGALHEKTSPSVPALVKALSVFRTGRLKELLGEIEMDAPLYSRPIVAGDSLYLASASRLCRIAEKR